jgi:hypothetical protein
MTELPSQRANCHRITGYETAIGFVGTSCCMANNHFSMEALPFMVQRTKILKIFSFILSKSISKESGESTRELYSVIILLKWKKRGTKLLYKCLV